MTAESTMIKFEASDCQRCYAGGMGLDERTIDGETVVLCSMCVMQLREMDKHVGHPGCFQ